MIPYLAQGANSSIEDGAVIGLLLGKLASRNQLPQAIQLYEKMRKVRGEVIARESLQQVLPQYEFELFKLIANSEMSIKCATGRHRKNEMRFLKERRNIKRRKRVAFRSDGQSFLNLEDCR